MAKVLFFEKISKYSLLKSQEFIFLDITIKSSDKRNLISAHIQKAPTSNDFKLIFTSG